MKHVAFAGRLVMLGFGSIGQGVLPLILRHIDMPRERITIVTADARGQRRGGGVRRRVHRRAADARQLPRPAGAAARAPATSCSTCRSTCRRSR